MCGTLQCRCVGLWCCHAALSDVNGSGKVPFEFGKSGLGRIGGFKSEREKE